MNKPKTEEEIRLLDGQVGIMRTIFDMCADGSIKYTESALPTMLDPWILESAVFRTSGRRRV